MLVGFDGDVVADSLFALSEPGWNVGVPPVDGSGGESLLHSREIEVPGVVEEFVGFVPFLSLLPAGVCNADFGQGFDPFEISVDTGLLSSYVGKLGWGLPFDRECLHRVESDYLTAFCSSE